MSSLTFTMGDWNTAQTITVTGVNDAEADGNQVFDTTIAINTGSTVDSLYDALSAKAVSVTVTDDDAVGYTIVQSGGSTNVSESGTADTFTIVLDSQPNTRVRLNFTSLDTDEFSVRPVGLTWTYSDWNTAKTVTVTGEADDQDDGNQTGTLQISVGGYTNDTNYSALPNDNVSVNVTDIDTVGFTITEGAGSSTVSETGTTDTFTIELDTLPTGNVVIDLTSADTAEVTVSPASLTFTTGDWNTPQTVTLTGQSDNSDDGDQAIAITAAINTGSTADTQYDGESSELQCDGDRYRHGKFYGHTTKQCL